MSDTRDEVVDARGEERRPVPVIGIGASAGGLEALEVFFRAVPPATGAAFVVQQHLSPDFESRMDELLGRRTHMPVAQVVDGVLVEADHVYVAPPKKEMILSGGRLLLTDRESSDSFVLPIDRFFRSLAQDAGQDGVGVVLSGTGRDGSRGVKDISEAGGLVLVQWPESARFDGMPRSAIDTGAVDRVLEPGAMPDAIIAHLGGSTRRIGEPEADDPDAPPEGLRPILALLRKSYGIDFGQYKINTVARRVERRLRMSGMTSLQDYADELARDSLELDAMYRDLLIGVTRFFRDADAFEVLATQSIDALIEKASAGDTLRVWVAGCASGEEAYSLAILFSERIGERPIDVKIFATDLHEQSLQVGSQGVYDDEALAGVSDARRARFFNSIGDGCWQVKKPLRQMLVFARHNVLQDAPFTRLDLVTCRNLLIYLKPPAQRKALSLFHFGLKTGAHLLLGTSETPGQLGDEFETIDKHAKLYVKRRDVRLPVEPRMPVGLLSRGPIARGNLQRAPIVGADAHVTRLYERLLQEYAPASFLVDDNYELVHTFGGAERYLALPGGRTSTNLLELVPEALRTPLSGALARAGQRGEDVRYTGIQLPAADGTDGQRVRLRVQPFRDERTRSVDYLVALEPVDEPVPPVEPPGEVDVERLSRDYIRELETELTLAKENLQATVEELETSNEELQATNEELVASNEELQSTNEELHSVNEELYTVNAEHERQIEELTELTNDMDNLLHNIDVGVLFLDRELCVRKFTAPMATTFHLIPSDVGRRFDSFAHNIERSDLLADVRRVLHREEPLSCEVQNTRGELFYLRILPYRVDERVTGVVLTMIDISILRRTEARAQHLSKIVESSADAIIGRDVDGNIVSWNRGATALFGFEEDEVLGESSALLVPEHRQAELEPVRRALRRGESVTPFETVRLRKDGTPIDVSESVSPIVDEHGRVVGSSVISRDIRRRKRAEREVRQAIRQRDQFIAQLSHELRNPLMGLLTATDLLEEPSQDERTLERARNVVLRQTRQMARLLDDLLDVSRMRRDKVEMRRSHVTLGDAVEAAFDSVAPRAREAGVDLRVRRAQQPVWVYGDLARLQQLLVNLLDNAIKYTPAGKRVWLELARRGEMAEIRVADEGVGIEPDHLDTVFEPFRQAGRPVRGGARSMGLGLALVRAIARAHDGEVDVDSDGPGRGSVFTVRLPLSGPGTDGRGGDAETRGEDRGDGAVMHVLLVEDDDDNRELLARVLRSRGYQIVPVANGTDALAELERRSFDVAIMDLGLPDISGLELARRARPLAPRTYFIALTGHGRQRDREDVVEAGFDEHLVKPVRAALIDQVIREAAVSD